MSPRSPAKQSYMQSSYESEFPKEEVDQRGDLILPHQKWRKERAELPVSSEGCRGPALPRMPILDVDKKTPYVRTKEDHLVIEPQIYPEDLPEDEQKIEVDWSPKRSIITGGSQVKPGFMERMHKKVSSNQK